MSKTDIDFSLKWEFKDEGQYEMNVVTLNKSEKALLDYMTVFAKEANIGIKIEAIARAKGSFDAQYLIKILDDNREIVISVGSLFLGAAFQKFFAPNPKPKSTDVEKESQVIDLQEKINQGSLTIAQAESYIDNMKLPRKLKNAFYKANERDDKIKSIKVKSKSK